MKKRISFIFLGMLILQMFTLSAISIRSTYSEPTEIQPGHIFNIVIELQNKLEEDFTEITTNLNLESSPFAPYQTSSEKFSDSLEENEKDTLTFNLIALPTAQSGVYKIPVEINYKDEEDNLHKKEEIISVTINSPPELEVSDVSEPMIRGKENTISLKVINSGLSDIKFVYMELSDVSGIDFISEKRQYIGDIDSDDFDSLDYKILLKENANSNILLPITLNFRDSTNKEFTETYSINLRTYSVKSAQERGFINKPMYWPYVFGGIVIVIYFIRRFFKKRKK